MSNKANEINIVKKKLSYNIDGHQISINSDNGDVSLMFFQIFPFPVNKDGAMEAEIITNLRLTMDQAKTLCKTLGDGIKNFEEKGK